jgi:hypothetical protein
MKKAIFFLLMGFSVSINAQSKSELLDNLLAYKKSVVSNRTYDFPIKELFDALMIVGTQEYPNVIRESESRGYAEFSLEKEFKKEYLTLEIRGEKQPYRVSFSLKIESRSYDYTTKVYSSWQPTGRVDEEKILLLQSKVYEALYGKIKYPDELMTKIEEYNKTQTKDRKKILLGKDY